MKKIGGLVAQYLKPNSELGYIEDPAEIENLKINNLRHSILGCMLGDFNEGGDYVVSPKVVSELIEMEKYIVETYDNIELCKSCLKLDKQISFMVTFEGNRATLSLVEKLNYEANFSLDSGAYSNINEYVLDVVETSGEINRNAIYLRWNIKTTPGQIIDIFSCDESVLEKYFGLVNRFKYLLISNRVMLEKEEEIEEIEAEYSNAIFEILENYPKLKEAVAKTIKKTLEEKKDILSVEKPNFAKTFNEILENAIEENLNVLSEEEKVGFETQKHQALVESNIKKADIIPVEHAVAEQGNESPRVIVIQVPQQKMSQDLNTIASEFVAEVNKTEKRLGEVNDNDSEKIKTKSDLIERLTRRFTVNQQESQNEQNPRNNLQSNRNKLIGNIEKLGVPRASIGAKNPVAATPTPTPATVGATKPAPTVAKKPVKTSSSSSKSTVKKAAKSTKSSTKEGTKKPVIKKAAKDNETKNQNNRWGSLFTRNVDVETKPKTVDGQAVSSSLVQKLAEINQSVAEGRKQTEAGGGTSSRLGAEGREGTTIGIGQEGARGTGGKRRTVGSRMSKQHGEPAVSQQEPSAGREARGADIDVDKLIEDLTNGL